MKVAELIALAAKTAMALTDETTNGEWSCVAEILQRIELAADDLAQAGRDMEDRTI